MNNENQQPLSTQGSADEQEDQLGGTTNLSLEQLKEEGDTANFAKDNQNGLTDQDDLDNRDTEAYQPDEANNDDFDNGGSADEAANPTELNS